MGKYRDEWDDGSSPEEDIRNLTSVNYGAFINKIRDHMYDEAVSWGDMFPGIFKTINVKRCKEHPEYKQQELCDLYLNGAIPRECSASHYFANFTTLFNMYMRIPKKTDEFCNYDSEGTVTPFVESLLPKAAPKQPPEQKKPRRYIVNGILYYEK